MLSLTLCLIGRKIEGMEKIKEWKREGKERKAICFSFLLFDKEIENGKKNVKGKLWMKFWFLLNEWFPFTCKDWILREQKRCKSTHFLPYLPLPSYQMKENKLSLHLFILPPFPPLSFFQTNCSCTSC